MKAWTGRGAVIGAGVATLALAGGAWAGMDAGAQVDGVYRFTPERQWRAVAAAPVPAPPNEWPSAPIAAAPPPGSVWGQEVGQAERAFFDTGTRDTWQDEPAAPVRVHRGHRAKIGPAEVPAELRPIEADDNVEGGWVVPPSAPVADGPTL